MLYLLSEGSSAKKDGSRIVVYKNDAIIAKLPLRSIDGVVISRHAQISTHAVFELLKQNIPLIYIDNYGKVVGHLQNNSQSVLRLLNQINIFQNAADALELSKEIIGEKISNQCALISQYAKNKKSDELNAVAQKIRKYINKVNNAQYLDEIRGLEGMASKKYFGTFPQILDQSVWNWRGRSQHPAKDAINALLNYGYAFLDRVRDFSANVNDKK